jgi:hypothetical protein
MAYTDEFIILEWDADETYPRAIAEEDGTPKLFEDLEDALDWAIDNYGSDEFKVVRAYDHTVSIT